MYDVVENSVEGSDWDVWCSWLQLSTETIIWQRAATTTTAMIVGGKILIWISFQPFFIFPPKILIRISFPPFFIFSVHLKTICQLSRPVAWFRMSGGAIHLLKSKWTWNSWFFVGCFFCQIRTVNDHHSSGLNLTFLKVGLTSLKIKVDISDIIWKIPTTKH